MVFFGFFFSSTARKLTSRSLYETLALLHPFFPQGWATLPNELDEWSVHNLAAIAGIALRRIGAFDEAFAAVGAALLERHDTAPSNTLPETQSNLPTSSRNPETGTKRWQKHSIFRT